MSDLYLFDIDGTLLDSISSHLKSWRGSYLDVLNLNLEDKTFTEKFGKPENQINEEICGELGINFTPSLLESLIKQRASVIGSEVVKGNIKVLPGVYDLLNYLRAREEFLGVVTGNGRAAGEALLEGTDLIKYFSVRAYNNLNEERKEIVKRAVLEARERKYNFTTTIVIGDTPSDVKAGKAVGAYTVAVATGHVSKEKLLESGADLTLDSLGDYQRIISGVER